MMLEFVKVSPEDEFKIEQVYDILKKAGEYMFEQYGLMHWKIPYEIEKIKRDTLDKEVYLVMDKDNNKYLATFMLTKAPTVYFKGCSDDSSIYLSKLATATEFLQKGIGTKCLEFMERKCIEEDIEKIRFDVYDKSEQAIKFYKKNGFIELFQRQTTYFTVICMEKSVVSVEN